jgi:hypothetical protein
MMSAKSALPSILYYTFCDREREIESNDDEYHVYGKRGDVVTHYNKGREGGFTR